MPIPVELLHALHQTERLAVLTGAGISAESGIPTFREAQTGLWAQYEPGELATPQAFALDPKLVWEWYEWRRRLVAKAHPNPGHFALADLEDLIPDFTLITQNVDGLHKRAGSRNVIELHGDITRNKCSREGVPVDSWKDRCAVPPRCPYCGAYLRPDVVWFGEDLRPHGLQSALSAARNAQVFLSIGTSALVHPAAGLPMQAKIRGALLVEVNPEDTPLTKSADFALRGTAGELLPELLAQVFERSSGKA